jgi:hypothetical protein
MLLLPGIEIEFSILQPVTFLIFGSLRNIYVAQERNLTFYIRRVEHSYTAVCLVSQMCN